jgi:hypothetical protein
MSDALPSGQNSVGSCTALVAICGVRPMPGMAASVGSPSWLPSPNPGLPSSHMSRADTAWAPTPRSPWEVRWYCRIASSGAPR